jgi:ABC-type dipeptide/oligopeptide/nickel transport system permease component
MTLIMRLITLSEMLEVLAGDYIRFARARGLSARCRELPPCPEKR